MAANATQGFVELKTVLDKLGSTKQSLFPVSTGFAQIVATGLSRLHVETKAIICLLLGMFSGVGGFLCRCGWDSIFPAAFFADAGTQMFRLWLMSFRRGLADVHASRWVVQFVPDLLGHGEEPSLTTMRKSPSVGAVFIGREAALISQGR